MDRPFAQTPFDHRPFDHRPLFQMPLFHMPFMAKPFMLRPCLVVSAWPQPCAAGSELGAAEQAARMEAMDRREEQLRKYMIVSFGNVVDDAPHPGDTTRVEPSHARERLFSSARD